MLLELDTFPLDINNITVQLLPHREHATSSLQRATTPLYSMQDTRSVRNVGFTQTSRRHIPEVCRDFCCSPFRALHFSFYISFFFLSYVILVRFLTPCSHSFLSSKFSSCLTSSSFRPAFFLFYSPHSSHHCSCQQ